jgi:glycosyltransferase involved in cell wall biosynthesis
MGERPKVSVLMTVYNAEPYLRTALDSLVNQTFDDWELVVIENGSTDESPRILTSFEDERIRPVRLSENIGRTAALREAFNKASGEYFAVLDADDVSHPDRLTKQTALLDECSDVVLVGTWANRINEGGQVLIGQEWTPSVDARDLRENLAWANPVVHSSAMYRGDIAIKLGGYPADLPYAQDWGLWLRLAREGRVAILPEFLCQHRVLSSGMTQNSQYGLDVSRDGLALLSYASRYLALGRDSKRRNREEKTIFEVKYGLALLGNRRWFIGLLTLTGALLRRPTTVFRNRVVRRWTARGRPGL